MSTITATTWVPRGFAAPYPQKYDFDEDEYERISKLAQLRLDDAKEDLGEAQDAADSDEPDSSAKRNGKATKASITKQDDDDLKEYDLENYDNEDEPEVDDTMGMFANVKSLRYHESNDEDPYITLKETDDDDEERQELQILPTDNLLLASKIEDEIAHLEIYVYEDEADNLYVHHDIMLPAIPLCVEWLDIPVGKDNVEKDSRGNFVAVGTFDPDIEIWDLDIIDCMYPNAILGQQGGADKTKKKKNKKSKKTSDEYHVDAVLSLAANRNHRNLLASASADTTVKLWDLNTAKCASSYSHHTDKVCTTAWHPQTSTVLLSGSYDRTVLAADLRAPNATVPRWGVESDVETVRWDPHDPNYFYITTEAGIVHHHDARNAPARPELSKPVWTLQAHDESVSAFDVNPIIPGFLATGSTDKEVKLWNVQASGPSLVVSRNPGVGKIFSTNFAPDAEVGFRLAVAGSQGTVQIWDTSTNAAIRKTFAHRVGPTDEEIKERFVGVADESSESGSDEEEGAEENGAGQDGWESMDED
ncbi:MAG: hypothetical protein M4579_001900 [Chaenotheca gracillima]|nr:MAG: hypothetical protein M4579_001900 [Chaenotheca gracillima]